MKQHKLSIMLIDSIKSVIVLCIILFLIPNQTKAIVRDSILYNGFGYLKLYKPGKSVNSVIICLSGDGGWNEEIEGVGMHLKTENTLIIGVDVRPVFRYMNKSKSSCLYPAADFERMSQFVQKKLGYDTYYIPLLLGYSSGATLVYGLLAQAPQNTFKGGIALGFCPDLAVTKPLCVGSGKFRNYKQKNKKGFNLGPVANLTAPFVSLQGEIDQICNYQSTVEFLKHVPKAQVIPLPKVGHGFSVEKNWLPQLKQAYSNIMEMTETNSSNEAVPSTSLPVNITNAAVKSENEQMVLFISGDGGWTGFDQQIADVFALKGIPVIGLNALKYFWRKKTPQRTTNDVVNLIENFTLHWKKRKIILIGYSFGASVIPFIYNRLPENIKNNISSIGLLSPSKDIDFEIHVSDLFDFGTSSREFSVSTEINKIATEHLVCFFGKDEEDIPINQISRRYARIVYLEGGHHYSNGIQKIYNWLAH